MLRRTTALPKDKRLTRAYMNEQANKYFSDFAADLPDVHMFTLNDEGKVVWIQAVFGGRVDATTQIWPDEK